MVVFEDEPLQLTTSASVLLFVSVLHMMPQHLARCAGQNQQTLAPLQAPCVQACGCFS